MKRRNFIQQCTFGVAATYLSQLPISILKSDTVRLTILHTNDVHSRIDPFPDDGSRNAGQGGVAKRATLINKIRAQKDHVLLLDAGDMFQGTPYFNLFGGELELKLMSALQYDAGTIGNHDFDAGIDGLAKQLPHANFPLINANYNWKNTPLENKVLPYKTWMIEDVKIGIYGLGIELESLVPKALYGETVYMDPVAKAREYEEVLRFDEKCDYIICLSHLGYQYRDEKVSDVLLAQSTSETDLIIGGHTHTFMTEPRIEKNQKNEPVIINQVGFAGILLGQIDVVFEKSKKRRKKISSDNQLVK